VGLVWKLFVLLGCYFGFLHRLLTNPMDRLLPPIRPRGSAAVNQAGCGKVPRRRKTAAPQWLKPDGFSCSYGTAEAEPLQSCRVFQKAARSCPNTTPAVLHFSPNAAVVPFNGERLSCKGVCLVKGPKGPFTCVLFTGLKSLRKKPLRQKNHPSAAKAGLILQFLRHS
jgi:hypothetical protein